MKAMILIACSFAAVASASGQSLLSSPQASERYAAERSNQQLMRIKALEARGKADNYESFRATKLDASSFNFPATKRVQSQAIAERRAQFQNITINETAINLAALGFDASDVAIARRAGIDLAEVAHHVFSASSTPQEQVLLADTVVVARAFPDPIQSTRQDGYLSELRFEVMKSIKGTSLQGDEISIPLRSGTNPDGTILTVTSELSVVPNDIYLLILSKNWYQQLVIESGKNPATQESASLFSAYQLDDDNALLHRSSDPIFGGAFRSVAEVVRVSDAQSDALHSKD
ncbi:hypothetical protein [Pseudoxanthomonas sp. JBR18]|uniref:hypothetical protein n=1 Tax=Pseudoxanthomonas sp. JBR18 TaxID=2969308 RepID=UPI0023062D2D|nr:hypothetical protein [Pseudoxanthomonas sp. JBR18]WCE05856.1 hypothetical protein PJ250_07880 [Pseudoxanthomonas sp. JBR18]